MGIGARGLHKPKITGKSRWCVSITFLWFCVVNYPWLYRSGNCCYTTGLCPKAAGSMLSWFMNSPTVVLWTVFVLYPVNKEGRLWTQGGCFIAIGQCAYQNVWCCAKIPSKEIKNPRSNFTLLVGNRISWALPIKRLATTIFDLWSVWWNKTMLAGLGWWHIGWYTRYFCVSSCV